MPGDHATAHVRTNAPIIRLIRPFQEFAHTASSGGIVLLACAAIALILSNSGWAHLYDALWHTPIAITVEDHTLRGDLHFWVNDLLMAIFFFVVGLEIKRELLVGELASIRQAALPILGALGGVVVPATIYTFFNFGTPAANGWGIPMATDIAFALGVLALLGERVPIGLKVFLAALAIVDDIAAVLVIAIFYTENISWAAMGGVAICMLVLILCNRLGVRHPIPYALLGIALWVTVLSSGVHATIAGVLLAFVIPAQTRIEPAHFLAHSRAVLAHFEAAAARERSIMSDQELHAAVETLEDACDEVQAPLQQFESSLHGWVTFLIMPVFAFANAGLPLSSELFGKLTSPVGLGVFLGLFFGKPIGVFCAAWLAVKLKVASLPAEVTWSHIHGAGWLAGIGFTMSLFVADLAFGVGDNLNLSKIAILGASIFAGGVGSLLLLRASRSR